MINYKFYFFSIMLLGLSVACSSYSDTPTDEKDSSIVNPSPSPKIIFDTDMGPDYDDVGAITVLHALAAQGECEILATLSSCAHPSISPTIEAFNTYFGHPDIPVGSPADNAPNFTAKNGWNDTIIKNFLPEVKTNADYPSAVEVYRKTLASQPDGSVTIVTVGFISNLAELLKSTADEYSELNGMELVKQKVKHWVAMAGTIPQGREFNVYKHAEASYEVFRDWPTPVLLSGFEIGVKIKTGRKVAEQGSATSPVQWAYNYNLQTYIKKEEDNRSSWDQTAVLVAVRNPEKYFYVNGPGKIKVDSEGSNEWDADESGKYFFLVHKYPYQHIADIIDDLMMYEPK
ncbi:nucleoside hydrolase [Membranihabitans marinus]|uniref:nucleoside hydrolase n=1 Tax=Membranihabitans marinus TaxID=1227546 RepID=UPI001F1B02F3|nr:nucleoside hydrolase [Membranihabitans marinus]